MTVIEIAGQPQETPRGYRLGHLLTVVLIVIALLYGLNMRRSIQNSTVSYTDIEVGIALSYPSNWLIDFDGDYVLRVRDLTRPGYKTTLQMTIQPVGSDVAARNILDNLTISRANVLTGYEPQSIEPYTLGDEIPATAMSYFFVDTETNKFLSSEPIVVQGLDILVIEGGQALIITFRSDSQTFERDLTIFNRILSSLEF